MFIYHFKSKIPRERKTFCELFLPLSLIALSTACSNDHVNKKEVFVRSYKLQGEIIINAGKLTDPGTIAYIDSTIIIGNKKGDPLIELYNQKGNLLCKTIKKGEGPAKIEMLATIQPDYVNHKFYTFDLLKHKILSFSLQGLLSQNAYQPSLIVDFNKSKLPFDAFQKVSVWNNSFISQGVLVKGRFSVLDKDGNQKDIFQNYPRKVDSTLSDKENAQLYVGKMVVSPDNTRMAFATYTAGILDIYDLAKREKPIWSDHEFYPEALKRMYVDQKTSVISYTGKSLQGYSDISSSDQFVFAIYSGRPIDSGEIGFSDIIRVVSWDGKQKFKLLLDKKISQLAASRNGASLYAIAKNSKDEPEIVKYNLPLIK